MLRINCFCSLYILNIHAFICQQTGALQQIPYQTNACKTATFTTQNKYVGTVRWCIRARLIDLSVPNVYAVCTQGLWHHDIVLLPCSSKSRTKCCVGFHLHDQQEIATLAHRDAHHHHHHRSEAPLSSHRGDWLPPSLVVRRAFCDGQLRGKWHALCAAFFFVVLLFV